MDDYISRYYQQIIDGSITTSKWVKLVYQYLIHGCESNLFHFDQKKADKAIKWIEEHCYHVEGPLAPGNLKLADWQKAMISAIFGIVDDKGYRQFREVVLVVARKNGKSLIASGVGNYMLREDGGYGAKVYCIAPKLDQAEIIYWNTWMMIQLDPAVKEAQSELNAQRKMSHNRVEEDPTIPKKRVSDIYVPATNSSMKKIAFSAKKSDGFNPSLAICDEIASWQGDQGLKQYEVLRSGMGARPEGLMLSCTTSGYVNDSIYDELIKRSTRFLLGDSSEHRLLPFLYIIDDFEKWNDINELRKSNPNLGVSVTHDYLLEEIAIAEGSLSKRGEFITKYCCLKQNSSHAWLPEQIVDEACQNQFTLEDFRGNYCVGGIDLSQTRDLTACCIVVEKAGQLYVFEQFFLPAERIDEATQRDGIPYQAYIQRGILTASGDNFVDYHDCFNWFRQMVEEYEILPLKVGYDRYSAQYLIQDLTNYGFQCDDVYQGENLYPVIQEMQGMLEDHQLHIGANDLLKIHLLNSAVKISTERGRGRLVKLSPNDHIDGTAALLDALTVRQKYYGEIGEQLKNEV